MENITHHRHGGGWQNTTLTVIDRYGTVQKEDYEFVSIRGRGNSSWSFPKKPFRLRFETHANGSRYQHMLDSSFAARNWTFIPNFSDKTLLRNYSAYHLARQLDGMIFAPNTWLVDVYAAGIYQGVYMMSDQISEVTEGRVNLTSNVNPEFSEYLLEWCSRAPDEGIENEDWVRAGGGWPFSIDFGGNSPAHVEYLRTFLDNVHETIVSGDFAEIEKVIDINSFIDFYLVQEFFKNTDVRQFSLFFTIRGTGENRRLHAGPVWDFDIAAGNTYYIDQTPYGTWATNNYWLGRLMNVPQYREIVVARWNEIKDNQVRNTIEYITYTAERYQPLFERNFERWDILGIYTWPNPPHVAEIDTFMGQVEFLVDFLERRFDWLSDYFGEPELPPYLPQGSTTIILNHIFGGRGGNADTPISHDFVELYNISDEEVDISGWTLEYSTTRSGSGVFNGTLTFPQGTVIPAFHSFLIRGGAMTSHMANLVVTIDTYDYDWLGAVFDNDNFSRFILRDANDDIIDAFSNRAGDDLEGNSAFNTISRQRSARRINFQDTNCNATDWETVIWNALHPDDIADFLPRSLSDGAWGLANQ
jgi:hypothetical protein